jgi:hypothetical protein
MSVIYPVESSFEERKGETVGYEIFCPGCKCGHCFYVKPPHKDGTGPVWTFDGNMEKPTFSPSMLVRGVTTCHSYVRKGMIEFLGDCTHDLVGKTVPLPDF